MEKIKPSL
ncbi:hypothetical protein CP8484711_1142A, partial [Chlamydia psittaci 84-8471/1]